MPAVIDPTGRSAAAKKICPFVTMPVTTVLGMMQTGQQQAAMQFHPMPCVEEQCALWDGDRRSCAILSIARAGWAGAKAGPK